MLEHHMTAMTKMSEFIARFEHPSEAIDAQLDKETGKKMEENQKVVESLMKIVMLCRQGITFRGHCDDQIIFTNEEVSEAENEGNIIEPVHFRAETNVVLCNHLQCAPKNTGTPREQFKTN